MVHSPSWEANRFSISQEITHILYYPKHHYHIHRSQPPTLILSYIDPVHAPHPTSWRSNLILSSYLHLGLPSCLFPFRFTHQTLCPTLLSPISATCPLLLPFVLITGIIFGEECRSLSSSLGSFLHSSVYFIPLRFQISSSIPNFQTPSA